MSGFLLVAFSRDARAAQTPPSDSPRTGTTAAVDAKATSTLRIITLAPNLTEDAFALGYGEQVVADTDYCRFPPAAVDRLHVGGLYNPNVELILSLRPDLVFYVPHHKDLAARLEQAGLHTVMVPSETVDDVFHGIRLMGNALRCNDRADALVRSLRRRIQAIVARTESLPRKRILLAVDHEPASIRGLYAAGSGNYLDEILRIVGGDNILRDTPTTYPKISPEILLRDPPDVILDSKYAESSQATGDWRNVMARAWADIFRDCPRKPRVEFITEARVMIPGPSIVVAFEILARSVHGDALQLPPDDVDPATRSAADLNGHSTPEPKGASSPR